MRAGRSRCRNGGRRCRRRCGACSTASRSTAAATVPQSTGTGGRPSSRRPSACSAGTASRCWHSPPARPIIRSMPFQVTHARIASCATWWERTWTTSSRRCDATSIATASTGSRSAVAAAAPSRRVASIRRTHGSASPATRSSRPPAASRRFCPISAARCPTTTSPMCWACGRSGSRTPMPAARSTRRTSTCSRRSRARGWAPWQACSGTWANRALRDSAQRTPDAHLNSAEASPAPWLFKEILEVVPTLAGGDVVPAVVREILKHEFRLPDSLERKHALERSGRDHDPPFLLQDVGIHAAVGVERERILRARDVEVVELFVLLVGVAVVVVLLGGGEILLLAGRSARRADGLKVAVDEALHDIGALACDLAGGGASAIGQGRQRVAQIRHALDARLAFNAKQLADIEQGRIDLPRQQRPRPRRLAADGDPVDGILLHIVLAQPEHRVAMGDRADLRHGPLLAHEVVGLVDARTRDDHVAVVRIGDEDDLEVGTGLDRGEEAADALAGEIDAARGERLDAGETGAEPDELRAQALLPQEAAVKRIVPVDVFEGGRELAAELDLGRLLSRGGRRESSHTVAHSAEQDRRHRP